MLVVRMISIFICSHNIVCLYILNKKVPKFQEWQTFILVLWDTHTKIKYTSVESHQFEVLGNGGSISKHRKFEL